jgi:hypothetical protein
MISQWFLSRSWGMISRTWHLLSCVFKSRCLYQTRNKQNTKWTKVETKIKTYKANICHNASRKDVQANHAPT